MTLVDNYGLKFQGQFSIRISENLKIKLALKKGELSLIENNKN